MPHDHHQRHELPSDAHGRAFAIGVGLNTAFVAAEIVGGLAGNSVALLADAVHNIGDVLGLLLAWGAAWLARQPPTSRRTYGWGRTSILAALTNAMILLISVGAIGVEAIRRLLQPSPVETGLVMAIATAGILVNGGTALLFARGRESDLNLRAAFVHMAADAGLSAGVVVAASVTRLTGWLWPDPVASLIIAAVITAGTWQLLGQSVNLTLDAVPEGISPEAVTGYLTTLPGVAEVHDLHIWGLSTTQTALTAHLVCADSPGRASSHDVAAALERRFGIHHATVQFETEDEARSCRLRPDHVV